MTLNTEKMGTVALVINNDSSNSPLEFKLVAQISDEREIHALEEAIQLGSSNPLEAIQTLREKVTAEDEEFGNYVEELLSRPFVRPEIQSHGLQWLRSKLRIEEFQKCEAEATQVIADFAFKIFKEDPTRTDFILAGPVAKVRIRVFALHDASAIIPKVA